MGTLWEKLAGNTSTFALKMAFASDPDSGKGATEEISASWGELQIWVNGTNLCRHTEGSASIESVNWYLLPFLEWLTVNWDALFHEERLPLRNAAPDAWSALDQTGLDWMRADEAQEESLDASWGGWWRRHCIRAARDGGVFPDVVFRRWRDLIEISWGPSSLAGVPDDIVFLAPTGVHRIDAQIVTAAAYDVLSAAVANLKERCDGSARVAYLTKLVGRLKAKSNEKRVAWLAGLGTDARTVRDGWKRVTRWMEQRVHSSHVRDLLAVEFNDLVVHGSCDAALMFGAVAPTVGRDDALELANTMLRLWERHPSDVIPPGLVREEPTSPDLRRAWEQGYDLARELLEQVEHSPDASWVDVETIVATLGIELGEIDLQDDKIRGVSIVGKKSRPGIFVNRRNGFNKKPEGRRFAIAHELCHVLYDRSSGRRLAIASGPWAPRDVEQRANAFAAMLLMPEDLVSAVARTTLNLESVDGVAAIAGALHTSFLATCSHLRNLGYFDEETEKSLQEQVAAGFLSNPSAKPVAHIVNGGAVGLKD